MERLFPLSELPGKALNRLRQRGEIQRLLLPFGRSLQPERWIFVIGCYNSGTTLLHTLLSAHPRISGLPMEGVGLTDSLPRPEESGWPRMWCRCPRKIRLEPGPGMAERAERIRLQWSIWYPRQASNLLEKSVANAARMPFLQEYFRPAYFIYIVRNGYAVAKGIRRKADLRRWRNPLYESRYPIELCAEQWLRSDEVVSSDSSHIERFLHIYYEDLVADPERVMRQITDFLDLEPLCSELSGRDWKVHGISAGIGDMNESSLAGLTREEVQGIREVAGERLHFHQYAEPSVSGRV